jgi:DNA-binding YbaB/EbfC family protein
MFGLDQNAMMQKMQQALEESKVRLERTVVTSEAGSGLIRVEMNGNRKVTELSINGSLHDMDKEDLEDLLIVAINRAMEEANRVNENEVSSSARQFLPGI